MCMYKILKLGNFHGECSVPISVPIPGRPSHFQFPPRFSFPAPGPALIMVDAPFYWPFQLTASRSFETFQTVEGAFHSRKILYSSSSVYIKLNFFPCQ